MGGRLGRVESSCVERVLGPVGLCERARVKVRVCGDVVEDEATYIRMRAVKCGTIGEHFCERGHFQMSANNRFIKQRTELT